VCSYTYMRIFLCIEHIIDSVFRFENILCVVNSQSFDFGGVWWVRELEDTMLFSPPLDGGSGEWNRVAVGGREGCSNRRRKGRKLFSNQHRGGAPRHGLVTGPLNGGNLCKNVDNETKRTWWQKKNYKGQSDTWAYRFEIHITEYKFKHNIVYYTYDYNTLYECYKIWMELESLFKAAAQNILFLKYFIIS